MSALFVVLLSYKPENVVKPRGGMKNYEWKVNYCEVKLKNYGRKAETLGKTLK